ncbi:CBS domain-containing protein [Moritella sp.]|uniref:CBS domain-containing protein n=1 Tax=Moritella sp. TaxID=78556 RepID=UPI001DF5BE2B|nr:CBS domain-containing protein [Moritella sp.]MCJ8351471.1 CBS domain-containing protein [Moritella sp.]NQZ40233.1 CBS domain-containing protein [Moritella sp.]
MTKNLIKANAVMTKNYICMDGMQTIREAIDAMKQSDSKVIIVNKRDQHDAYGILVLSDIAKQVLAKDRSPDRVNIYEVMAKPIVSVPPQMDIRYCARLFERFGLSHAPVIENEDILGLIGYNELVLHEL